MSFSFLSRPSPATPSQPSHSATSPSKRSYRTSPTSSPDASRSTTSPRVLRTKLSNVENGNEVGARSVDLLPIKLNDGQGARGIEGMQAGTEGEVTTPNTPPETVLEPLIGLGMAFEEDRGRKEEAAKVQQQDGSTQTATALRQQQELMGMSSDVQIALTRLCSQSWSSEYNTLKRAVASAAYEAAHQPAPAPPTYPAMPRVPSVPAIVHQAPPRPASSAASPARPSLPPRSVSENPSRLATASLAKTSLTPVISTFTFAPSPTTSSSSTNFTAAQPAAAAAVDGLLANLVAGEPVTVEKTKTATVVTQPSPASTRALALPPMEQLPLSPPSVPGLLPGMMVVHGVAVKTSVSHPINISPLIPPELLPYISSRLFSHSPSSSTATLPSPFILRPSPSNDLLTLTTPSPSTGLFPAVLQPTLTPSPLGNFVLSSCPGKKVRMNGEPMRGGRGAICRDVRLDLQRARDEHGVEMVICCLDDTELEYLGVPWGEYSDAAARLGIEVVRMPMVEGFAPKSPEGLDGVLERVVREYTMRGKSVLSHCRGGIGRAGLVASCWMLKMGLVTSRVEGAGEAFAEEKTMDVVVKVIELIRKRRSVKAIETAHQVHFLVQYVGYLQRQATEVSAKDVVASLTSSSPTSSSSAVVSA